MKKLTADEVVEFFFKTVKEFNLNKYLNSKSIGGSSRTDTRRQCVEDIKENEKQFIKIYGKQFDYLVSLYAMMGIREDFDTIKWVKRSVSLYY